MRPSALDASLATPLAQDLQNLEATKGPIRDLFDDAKSVTIQTSLPAIIDRYSDQRRIMVDSLVIAAIGLFTLSLALVGLVAALIIERRRAALLLLRARGASARQLISARLIESMAVCLPPALVGWLVSRSLIPNGDGTAGLTLALAVGAGGVIACVVASLPLALRPLGLLQREVPRQQRLPTSRAVVDGVIVVLAIGGVFLLRRRGLIHTEQPTALGVDPYIAAVPILLAAAAGVLLARAIPFLSRALTRVTERRRDVVPFIAARRLAELPPALCVAMIMLVVSVATASLGFIIQDSIARDQRESAWLTTGAAYRLNLPDNTTPDVDVASVNGVEAVAPVIAQSGASVSTGSGGSTAVTIVAVDPTAYRDVVRGTLLGGSGLSIAKHLTRDAPIPGMLVQQSAALSGLSTHDKAQLLWGRAELSVEVSGLIQRLPGIDTGGNIVVVSVETLNALTAQRGTEAAPTIWFVSGSPGVGNLLRDRFRNADVDATVTSADEMFNASRDAPLARGIVRGFWLSAAAAIALAVGTCIASIVLTSPARHRQLALLRTLGLSQRQSPGIVAIEVLPILALASVVGSVLGIAIATIIATGLALHSFSLAEAETTSGALHFDWIRLGVMPLIVLGVTVLAVGIYVRFAQRRDLRQLLRIGDV
jgi:putative ABC transport system permease protein